jgi:hypothetical protein
MTTQCRVHSTLPIRGVGFQYRTRGEGTDKIRVCIDFRNLNKATPKDEYSMPIADMLINNASGH